MLKNKVLKNASWIIACRIAQSVLSLIISMITARYLGPSNFGVINYAASVVSFVSPLMYLGLNSILVQEIINRPEEEGAVVGTATCMSFCSAILCILGVIAFSLVANAGETVTVVVCALYSLLLLFQAVDLVQYWFQAKYMAKYTSITMLCAYTAVSLYKIYLLISQKSVYWFAVSHALDFAIISGVLLIIYHKKGGQKLRFSGALAKKLFNKSRHYIVSSMMVVIFGQTDKIMIKLMIGNEAAGYYAAAVTAASATSFLFSAIIDSMRPSIFESAKIGRQPFEKNVTRLYTVVIYASLAQSVLMSVLAKPIIFVLYGKAYYQAIPLLALAVWYTTFSYMGPVRDVWILAADKQRYMWVINFTGAMTNVVLNFILIPVLGAMGAALASVITQMFTNFILGFILKPIRQNNTLLIKSINPQNVKGIFASVFSKSRQKRK